VLPKEIVGAIANEGGIDGKLIGQINLFDEYSTVELPAALPADLMDILRRTRVRQVPLRIRLAEVGEGDAHRPPRPKSPWSDKGEKPAFEGDRPRRAASADFSSKPPYRGDKNPAPHSHSHSPHAHTERKAPGKSYGGKPPAKSYSKTKK
jgi:ATP-dependent RNA helicase DeaD